MPVVVVAAAAAAHTGLPAARTAAVAAVVAAVRNHKAFAVPAVHMAFDFALASRMIAGAYRTAAVA